MYRYKAFPVESYSPPKNGPNIISANTNITKPIIIIFIFSILQLCKDIYNSIIYNFVKLF